MCYKYQTPVLRLSYLTSPNPELTRLGSQISAWTSRKAVNTFENTTSVHILKAIEKHRREEIRTHSSSTHIRSPLLQSCKKNRSTGRQRHVKPSTVSKPRLSQKRNFVHLDSYKLWWKVILWLYHQSHQHAWQWNREEFPGVFRKRSWLHQNPHSHTEYHLQTMLSCQ